MGEDDGQIVGKCIFNAAVTGAVDFAGSNDIPDGNVVTKQKLLFLGNGNRQVFPEQTGKYFPESILWMTVKETSTSLDLTDGKTSKNQNRRRRRE